MHVPTGESLPVEKGVGNTVFSSTLNEAGYLEVETEKAGYREGMEEA